MLVDQGVQNGLGAALDNRCSHPPIAFQHPDYDSLTDDAREPFGSLCEGLGLPVLMHILDLAADECFVHLDWSSAAADQFRALILHGQTDAMNLPVRRIRQVNYCPAK
jgi:hypothetical protein